MKKREQQLANMVVAGYHGDQGAFVRMVVENRIDHGTCKRAYDKGVRAKQAGVRCQCPRCEKKGVV